MASRRELIEPHKGDKRYVRRTKQGQFKETDDVGRSLAQDRRRKAKTSAPRGQGAGRSGCDQITKCQDRRSDRANSVYTRSVFVIDGGRVRSCCPLI